MASALTTNIDEKISKIFFEASLPPIFEVLLSIPGNWFGLAPFALAGPIFVASLTDTNGNRAVLRRTAAVLFMAYLALWCAFVRGNSFCTKQVLFNWKGYLIFPPCAVALNHFLIPDQKSFSRSVYPLFIYAPTLIVVLILKNTTLRMRPCAKYKHLHDRKYLSQIPRILSGDHQTGSFPSADTALSASFVIPIASEWPNLAATLVFLSCVGRLYFLAHHAFDTICGILVTILLHALSGWVGWGIEDLSWWQPLLSQCCLSLLFLVKMKNSPK